MIFDTDIFIWIQRGNQKAAKLVDLSSERYLFIHILNFCRPQETGGSRITSMTSFHHLVLQRFPSRKMSAIVP
jgi:hypothetical protein